MTDIKPTGEQQAIIDAVQVAQPGEILVVEARAGSGKTTTARQIAKTLPGQKILYMAFNRSTKDEAERSFPANTTARTSHSLAWGFGRKYTMRMTAPMGKARRVKMSDAARQLGVTSIEIGETVLEADRVLRLALAAVGRFARSADDKITRRHIWRPQDVDQKDFNTLIDHVLPVAHQAWEDIQNGRVLNVGGEHYIKMWQLTHPHLNYDVIIYDEAQDANGAVADVVERQKHALVIAIGDSAQAINGWNGAVDALAKFNASKRLPLSQSFRFGQAVADEGNKFLGLLGVPTETLVKGFEKISSSVETLTSPDAVLCRTNGGCITVAMKYLALGKKVSIVGGGGAFKDMAKAAAELQAGRRSTHPDLAAFKSWDEVQRYAKEDEGADLRPFVKIIDQLGADEVIRAMDSLTYKEAYADVVVSTMHKSKGREWKRVQIHTDCPEPKRTEDGRYTQAVSDEMAMLYYVAVTRAQEVLDNAGLAWIDSYLAQFELVAA